MASTAAVSKSFVIEGGGGGGGGGGVPPLVWWSPPQPASSVQLITPAPIINAILFMLVDP
jgi:hypothetical protein